MADTSLALNQHRRDTLDRYRGAFLGLALADGIAARGILERCEMLLAQEDEADPDGFEEGDAAVAGALAALWQGGDEALAAEWVGRTAKKATARQAAAVMARILAGTSRDALPPLGVATEALRAAATFAEGLRFVGPPERARYGILAGAFFGESGLDERDVSRLPLRAVARAVAGAIVERLWFPAPADAPMIACEHCRALLEGGGTAPGASEG
ncbi:MAG: hypothetical protein RMM58_02915 [Chloroflexota bacterium]|nr:hypothetical protein [Dehalococcoidia bacterium]MDW8252809.1 hypothetical protein [Chloroflexota bacterium]